MTTTEKTVGQVATEFPLGIGVLEKYGIDYCCGGARPFEQACRERGVAPEALLAEIDAARKPGHGAGRDWTQASLSELIAHILGAHHEYLRAELPTLEQRVAKVVENHGPRFTHLQGLQQVYLGLQDELYGHMHKEEMILFPAIEDMEASAAEGGRPMPSPFGTIQNPIRVMLHEHDNAAHALREMRRLTDGYRLPEDVCPTFRALYEGLNALEADLHQHIHLENNILFPRAAQLEAR